MGHKLIHAIASAEQMDREQAIRVYVELLEKDSDKPADLQRFKTAMDVLGKTPSDLQADQAALAEARRLQQAMREGAGLDGARTKAQKDVADYAEETTKVVAGRRRRHAELVGAASELEGRWNNAQQAVNQLNGLRQKHGPLLAHVPAASLQDLE